MYPFPIFLFSNTLPPAAGPVLAAYTLNSNASDVGGNGIGSPTGNPQTLIILTENGGVYGTGNNLASFTDYALFGKDKPSLYGGQWFTFVDSGAKAIYPYMEGFLIRMEDNTFRQVGATFDGTQGKAGVNVWAPKGLQANAIRYVAPGLDHCLIMMETGNLLGVGANFSGSLGFSQQNVTDPVTIRTGVSQAFSSQKYTAYFILQDGSLYASGRGENGNLMNGSTSDRASFAKVLFSGAAPSIKEFIPGAFGTKTITTAGDVYVTGDDLGIGLNNGVVTSPTKITNLPNSSNGFSLPLQTTLRSSLLLANGDKTRYFGNPRLGRAVGQVSDAAPGAYSLTDILTGIDHSLTTSVTPYGGGTVVVNNGNLYLAGQNRIFQDPRNGNQDIITPLIKSDYKLP